jgi:superfamily I DNA and/or RNA helicase
MASVIVQEFIQALNEEIEAIKSGRGGSIVKIFNGRFVREVSGLFVYVFNLENFLAVLDESPAEIEIQGNNYPAQVLLSQWLEVEVGIERFLGKFIPEAKLKTNLWYLLELLKKKFIESQNGTNKVNFSLSDNLFSGSIIDQSSDMKSEINYSISADPPNEAQKRAIEDSFRSQLSIIWGPPGTGKTRTIAQAIEAHLNAGRRVLLVSHANNAVDEALEKVAEQLKPTSFYTEGKLIRLGIPPQKEHLEKMEKDYEMVLLDKIAERLGESLVKEKQALGNEKLRLEDSLRQLAGISESLQKMKTLASELNAINKSISESTGKIDDVSNDVARLRGEQTKKRTSLVEAQSAGKIKRIFFGLDPQKIQRQIDQNTMAVDAKYRLLVEMKQRVLVLEGSRNLKRKEADAARANVDNLVKSLNVDVEAFESQRKEIEKRINTIISRVAEINTQLEEIQKKLLSEARLVATTLTKTFVAKQFPDTPFDVLILDEASMAPLPHLYWAASRCRQFVTIVGDFLQLPPICIAEKSMMAQKWLGRSIFDVLGIKVVQDAMRHNKVKMLDEQYRMVPEISAIPEKFFYGGMLRDSDKVKNISDVHDGVSDSPLILLDTSGANPWCSHLAMGGRFNLYNALLCATLAKRLISNIDSIRNIEKNPNARIGILTPYKAQARLINKILKDWNLSDLVRVSTVHTFQGGEEPIIIFDTCEGPGLRVAPMLDDTKNDSDARLVLNVAFTRAKYRLYCIAHTERLLSDLHEDSALAKIINYFRENAKIIDSETLVDNYFTSDFDKWAGELLPTEEYKQDSVPGTFYTERNFWANFFQDLKMVKERLIILSPFVSIRRSTILMNYFRAMRSRNVEIRVYTKPINQQVGEMVNQAEVVIEQLRSIGIKVVERRSMHQKIAILDNTISWEGSLNILSHRDTAEHMRRLEGSSSIEEIVRNLELDEEMAVGNQTEEKCPGSARFPNCDGYLVIRRSKKGGRRFYGCSNYPRCDHTKPVDGRRTRQR